MPACAFLTLRDPSGFVIDDDLAYPSLQEIGWHVEAVPWNAGDVEWRRYDMVIIRSTWDYHHSPGEFLETLARIDASGTHLENPLSLVRWNYRKTYLQELDLAHVPIAPTLWRDNLTNGTFESLFDELGTDRIVIKPVVSASADGTYLLDRKTAAEYADEIRHYFRSRPLMAQPFVHAVVNEGEYSLFYFNGTLSHTILKTPKSGDFRVQEEHGGYIRPVEPAPELLAAGKAAMQSLSCVPLYARVDFVRSNDNSIFWLMEFELIEPALYFRMSPDAPQLFAQAVNERMNYSSINQQNP